MYNIRVAHCLQWTQNGVRNSTTFMTIYWRSTKQRETTTEHTTRNERFQSDCSIVYCIRTQLHRSSTISIVQIHHHRALIQDPRLRIVVHADEHYSQHKRRREHTDIAESQSGHAPFTEQWTKTRLSFVVHRPTFVLGNAKSIRTKQIVLSIARSHNL